MLCVQQQTFSDMSLVLTAGQRNGYFDALWPADMHPAEATPDTTLTVLWALVDQNKSCNSTSLQSALASCTLQRLDTLHEQLLHLRYTCSFSLVNETSTAVKAASAEEQKAAAGNYFADSAHQSAAVAIGATYAADVPMHQAGDVTQHSTAGQGPGDAMSHGEAESELLQELQQLSGQVLQLGSSHLQALSSLKSESEVTLTSDQHTQDHSLQTGPLHGPSLSTGPPVWQQAADRLPLLASYASDTHLQAFMQTLLQTAFCSNGSSSSSMPQGSLAVAVEHDQTQALGHQPNSSVQAAAVLRQARLWQQDSIQAAWLHALVAQLRRCSNSAQSAPAPGSQASPKRRKRDSVKVSDVTDSHTALSLADASACSAEGINRLSKLLQTTCASVFDYIQAARASHSTHATSTCARAVSKKRKSVQLSCDPSASQVSAAATANQQLAALLQHAAEITTKQSLDASVVIPLALLMVQTQAWLVHQMLTTAAPSTSLQPPSSAAPSVRAVNDQSPTERHSCLPQSPAVLLHSLVSTQATLAQGLQSAPDAVAAAILSIEQPLWQWFAATAQLSQQLTSRYTCQSTVCQDSGAQSATAQEPLPRHALAASTHTAPDISGISAPHGCAPDKQACLPAGDAAEVNSLCAELLAHTTSSVRSLVSYSLGVRHAVAPSGAGNTGKCKSACDGLFEFVTGIAARMQVSPLLWPHLNTGSYLPKAYSYIYRHTLA